MNIDDIIYAIHQLGKRKSSGWVKLANLNKCLRGTYSDFNSVGIDSFLDLPKCRRFVVRSHTGAVRLSNEGLDRLEFLNGYSDCNFEDPHSVANVVRRYAGTLEPISFPIIKSTEIQKVEGRALLCLQTKMGEDHIKELTGSYASINKSQGIILGADDLENSYYFLSFDGGLTIGTSAFLRIDRGHMLVSLAEQIEKMTYPPKRFLEIIRDDGGGGESIEMQSSHDYSMNYPVDNPPPISLLWGPPGAGKTYGLARLIARYLSSNKEEDVLIIAPSNLAVDVLTEELLNALAEYGLHGLINNHEVLRYGYPAKPSILRMSDLLGNENLEEIAGEIRLIFDQLERARDGDDREQEIALKAIMYLKRSELKDLLRYHVNKCRIVSTTAALGYHPKSPIFEKRWGLVVVDEITMVPPAVIYFLSGLAKQALVLAGDPRQLGPVFEISELTDDGQRRLFGTDIFDLCGISSLSNTGIDANYAHNCLYRIMEQRRCQPRIWQLVEKWYPNVKTNTPETNSEHLKGQVTILDTSNCLSNRCLKLGKSWANEWSAHLSISIALTVMDKWKSQSVGIIVPYTAQERTINQILKNETKISSIAGLNSSRLAFGTIHKFQGSAADTIIIDLVGAPRKQLLGPLLSDLNGIRLLTVALTRARHQIILILDLKWHSQRLNQSKDNELLSSLIELNGFSQNDSVCNELIPMKNFCQGITAYTLSDEQEMDNFKFDMNYGIGLAQMHLDAQEYYEAAFELKNYLKTTYEFRRSDSRYLLCYYWLGVVYDRLGRKNDANAYYTMFIEEWETIFKLENLPVWMENDLRSKGLLP